MKHWKKLLALSMAALLSVTMLVGCGGGSGGGASGYPVTVGETQISSQPSGVVVLSDSLADVVLSLGYEAQLKGKSASCTQEELSILPDMTMDDPGAISGRGANVVLTDTEPTEEQRSAMEQQGIQVVVLAPATDRESLTELYRSVGSLFMGSETGGQKGERSANSTLLTLDDISRSIPEKNVTPTACYLYDLNGTAATNDTLVGKLFEYAGLINIDSASVTLGNPRYIFCDTGLREQLMNDSRYQNLSAVKNGRVYEIDAATMTRQGGSILKAVTAMAGYAYPELLSDGNTNSNLSDILNDDDSSSSKTDKKTNASSKTSSKSEKTSSEKAED